MTIAPTSVGETRLDELAPRTCAVIRRIETDGEEVQRLKLLGLCVGRQIEVVKSGDPLIIKIFGSRIGLAASLAECEVSCGDEEYLATGCKFAGRCPKAMDRCRAEAPGEYADGDWKVRCFLYGGQDAR